MNTVEIAKHNMIEQQIRPWEVLDSQVLNVLDEVNRAEFVKAEYKGLAYADCQIPLHHQSRMLPPVIEGRMLQSLLIGIEDSILEIGSGSGYISACLARLGKQVLSLEICDENLSFAKQNTANAGISNIEFLLANGLEYDYEDTYDVIAVNGSVTRVPESLKLALKPGGRMFIIEGSSPVMQALLFTRSGESQWSCQSLFETDLPALQL
ncbi:MAG: protein-L-isoaspartate O-methyltransferase [Gammaproteobacteria bacterium]|nr:protein-L-isoaspartate O-methyltransferase [Gammaproteobacteria bacterium]